MVIWILAPIFLVAVFWKLRLVHRRSRFLAKVEWDILEIRIPRDIIKTPKSMEQIFSSLYGTYSFGIKPLDKYLDGKVDLWVSFEMAGRGGGISFYVRTPKQFRNLVESAIYSQYPEAEISPTSDYTEELPRMIPNEIYDIWGTGYTLAKESPYPIRTYEYFEEVRDEKRIDPLSTIFEAMSKLKEDEMIWIQLLVSPTGAATGNDLKKKSEEAVKKIIKERSVAKKEETKGDEKKETVSLGMFALTPGDQNVIKAIENKSSKLPFQFTLRFVYIDRKDAFSPLNVAAVSGSFQQFNTQNLNSLKGDETKTSFGGWKGRFFPWYKKIKVLEKKRKIYDAYVNRKFGASGRLANEDLPILNTEELATIFHFPALVVKAPKLRPVHSRKGEPPVNLPME